MRKKEINVRKYVDTYVGRNTLEKIEGEIKYLVEKGYKVVVNVEGLSINRDYTYYIASIIDKYDCKFRGLGSKESKVEAYINTGTFVKEQLGAGAYIKWFKEQVEKADYPLMIRDNRLKNYRNVPMNIVKPVMFDKNYFHYKIIRPSYLEPVYLEEAIENGEDIYTRESIHLLDLAKVKEGFRFASTESERYTLDIFEAILSEKVKGFYQEQG